MGCVVSAGNKEDRSRSSRIDAYLRREKKNNFHEVKLLLLGAGESGKSTFIKQMKIILLKGFTQEERMSYCDVIHSNTIMAMRSILIAADKLMIGEVLPENKEKAALLTNNEILFDQRVTPFIAEAIQALWKDPVVLETYKRSNEYQLIDSASYFFENVARMVKNDFVPTPEDLLRARARTTGIVEITFELGGANWRMVDVGGQRNERKKWIHCFQDVTAVIFCVALSEYDQRLYEDDRVNRMHESLTLFEEISNCQWFSNCSMIMFLNKSDLFKEKIKHVDLNVCFKEYTGGCNYEPALEFLTQKFLGLRQNKSKPVYPHVTIATDTENVRFVFTSVRESILQQSLGSFM